MFRKFFAWLGRFADALSVWQVVTAWSLLGTTVTALMTWAAATIDPVWRLGWGAVVFAGVGIACPIMFLMAFSLIAWRYFRPLPPAALTVLPAHGGPTLGSPVLTVSQSTAPAPVGDTTAAVDRLARGELDSLKEIIQLQFKQTHDFIKHLETEAKDFRRIIVRVLRARDAENLLKSYDESGERLYDRLRHASPDDYSDQSAWANEYSLWRSCIFDFWALASGWFDGVSDPFATQTESLGRVRPPDSPLLLPFDNQHRYRIMVVAQDTHRQSRNRVYSLMSQAATPPDQ